MWQTAEVRLDVLAYSESVPTNLINFIAIQLLPPSTSSSNSRGAKGRKSCGRLHPSSQTTLTMAAVTLGSSLLSISLSLILGQAARSVSGYTRAILYSVTIVFLRMTGWEWLSRGSKSASTESARDGVMMCGRAEMGRDMMVGAVALRS